jgi:hypothetical protein
MIFTLQLKKTAPYLINIKVKDLNNHHYFKSLQQAEIVLLSKIEN